MMRASWDLNPLRRPNFQELKVKLLQLKLTTTWASNEHNKLPKAIAHPHQYYRSAITINSTMQSTSLPYQLLSHIYTLLFDPYLIIKSNLETFLYCLSTTQIHTYNTHAPLYNYYLFSKVTHLFFDTPTIFYIKPLYIYTCIFIFYKHYFDETTTTFLPLHLQYLLEACNYHGHWLLVYKVVILIYTFKMS